VESVANRKTHPKLYEPQTTPNQQILGAFPINPHVLQILFRLAGPRTWIFASTSFTLGYALSGGTGLLQIGIGVAIASLVTAATNIVNAYADRTEDVVNQPARVFWLDQVGSNGIRAAVVFLYGLSFALSIFLSQLFIAILVIGVFNSIFYSARPFRFKTHPLSALISFSAALALPFLGGLSVQGTPDLNNPMLWLVTYFMFTYGTVKNLPDYTGDKRAGVKTSATIFKNINNAILFAGTLLFTPYVLLISLVAFGLLEPIYLATLALLPLLGYVFYKMHLAKDSEHLERAHTLGYFYAITFVLFTLVLTTLTVTALVIVAVAYTWALFVSKTNLHSRVEKRDWEHHSPSHGSSHRPHHSSKVKGR
jgi:4-hydroxybenzoate polyprenyltransferase